MSAIKRENGQGEDKDGWKALKVAHCLIGIDMKMEKVMDAGMDFEG
jgi:hypothetical protein